MNRRSLLAAGAATLAACAAPRSPALSVARAGATLKDDLDEMIGRAMALGFAPGLGVAVYSPDAAYARGFGVTTVGATEQATADTAFYIASSTKSLTSLAFASLHARGEFDLDASLAAYAPEAALPAEVRPADVTFRQLLSHTGGMDNPGIGFRLAFSGQHDPAKLWSLLAACEPNPRAPPGRFEYTNLGYNIATILTDRKLGVRWQDLLEREIFAPAGMMRSSARMSRPTSQAWSIARPHMAGADGKVAPIYLQKTDQTMQSAGGVIMSANDALRLLELMIEDGRLGGRQIIPVSAIAQSRTPMAQVGDMFEGYRREQYGLGWYLGPYRGEPMLHDFGSFAGFRTHVSYLPRRRVGVAVFVNDSTVAFPIVDAIANYVYDHAIDRDEAARRFDDALKGTATKARQTTVARAADRTKRAKRPWTLTQPREAYVGSYESDVFGSVDVNLDGDAMHLRCGVLHCVAEPFTQPNSVRVEITPGSGSVAQFQLIGGKPIALALQGQRLPRVA